MRVTFIGLGVMGYPMAGHLAASGFDVCVFNRTAARAAAWVDEHAGRRAATPREAAADAAVVCCCVGNDDDVRAVLYGDDGALAGMRKGAILVDHTTASANLARELEEACRERDLAFLDAPVSGGQAGAEKGQLTIMVGGAASTFDAVQPVFDTYARAARLLGPAGSGQLAKMVNQVCIAGILQGLAEGLHLARRVGLDATAVVDVISKGAAQSWQMENRSASMLDDDFDFGFAVDWMRKDLAIALDEARRSGARLPLTALVDQFYADVQASGGGRWDTSSLFTRLEKGAPDPGFERAP